jgi:hypothetical protein
MLPMRTIVLAALALLAPAMPAFADGSVLRAKGCGDKIFVAGENSYSVLVASQTGAAADGDKIVGDTDRIGFGSFLITDSGRRFSASIDERGLTKSEITARIAASCHAAAGYDMTSGQVERAEGCGGKIFVNTPKGYAVVEQLSGGLIASGDTLNGPFNKAGRATVKNPQTGGEYVVFVDDFGLPKSAEARKVVESCH